MSAPFESGRRVVERIYRTFPQCPICKSKRGFKLLGWINDYIQCYSCKAKWLVGESSLELVEAPRVSNSSTFEEMIGKKHSFAFWKNLDLKKIEKRKSILKLKEYPTTNCPSCGYLNPIVFSFCGRCGVSLKQNLISCSMCHEPNTPTATFCCKCGALLPENDQTKIY